MNWGFVVMIVTPITITRAKAQARCTAKAITTKVDAALNLDSTTTRFEASQVSDFTDSMVETMAAIGVDST
jgi:hypothetical protein